MLLVAHLTAAGDHTAASWIGQVHMEPAVFYRLRRAEETDAGRQQRLLHLALVLPCRHRPTQDRLFSDQHPNLRDLEDL